MALLVMHVMQHETKKLENVRISLTVLVYLVVLKVVRCMEQAQCAYFNFSLQLLLETYFYPVNTNELC
jgi:hypothetical protein